MSASRAEREVEFRWMDLPDGNGRDLFSGSYRAEVAGDPCPGVRVVRGHGLAGEAEEGYLPSHTVVVNVGASTVHEFRWEGGPWKSCVVVGTASHVLPAGFPHAVRWREPVHTAVVQLSPDFVSEVAGELIGGEVDLRPSTGQEDRFLAQAAIALADDVRAGSPGGRLFAENLATAMARHLLRSHGQARPRAHSSARLSRDELGRVLRHVSEQLATNISLVELAALVQMDVFRFVRAFEDTMGVPPHQYVLRARITLAKDLLARGMPSIAEVALATGFGTTARFATIFRRMTGRTPREYRDGRR